MDVTGPDSIQELPSSPADAAHDGADGHTHQLRRHGITQTNEVDQGKDLPLLPRKLCHLELHGQDSDKTFVPLPKFRLRSEIFVVRGRHHRFVVPHLVEKGVS